MSVLNTNNEYKQPERFYLEHAPYMLKKSWCEGGSSKIKDGH